ncbi:LysM peptidoglycan-binding domain-containing protein [Phycicoccus duodecadis]|uniref:Soluble lytic murein transglycosylase-like protein n=1 Tax=Phycicoccus duodecadis TaxID=173053 RepID=A0A2N3YFD8_9MICO|nr:LysM peptidoglycan-binding domain-containing protein [Phycicoccus duodecadis]PKW25582.1 soluble lytic murein transglycosylase-like protein [Phycicoccus duodecadis]
MVAPATPPPAVIPLDHVSAVVAGSSGAPYGWTGYRVRPGDTLEVIAARFRTSVGTLAARNHLRSAHLIMAGSRLSVPRTAPVHQATPARTTTRVAATVHVVRSGETVSGIAARYRVGIPSILKANHLGARSLIHPGDRLVVRAAHTVARKAAARTAKAAAGPATRSYTVRSGDTLGGIASRYGTTVAAVARASRISSRAVLQVGQRLRVPRAVSSTHAVGDTFAGVRYPDAVVAAARRNHAQLARRAVPSRTQVKAMVVRTARRHGVDPRLALAVAFQESGWNQRAVSPANAVGVMQVIPSGGQWASSLVGRRLDLLDAQDNITAGVVMLRALTRATSSTPTAVAGYYQGLASVQQRGMYSDTKHYVANIMRLRASM